MGIIFLLLATSFSSYAQEENKEDKGKLNLAVDFSNRHVWRGQMSLDQECIKPTIEYVNKNFTIGAWGLYATDSSYDEIDLYIGYKIGNLSFMAYDFYMRPFSDKNKSLFDYSKEAGIHMLDFTATYSFDGNFPLSIMAAASWAANESNYSYKPTTDAADDKTLALGELDAVSMYLELSYPMQVGSTKVKYVLGMAPGKSRHARWFDEQGRKHYSEGAFYLTNIGLHLADQIQITDKFALPISGGLTFNPHQEKLLLQFNITLSN